MGKMKDQLMELCETPVRDVCSACDGRGEIEVDVPRPHAGGFNEGYIDTAWETCEDCNGDGVVDATCEECGNVIYRAYIIEDRFVVNNPDVRVCEECMS